MQCPWSHIPPLCCFHTVHLCGSAFVLKSICTPAHARLLCAATVNTVLYSLREHRITSASTLCENICEQAHPLVHPFAQLFHAQTHTHTHTHTHRHTHIQTQTQTQTHTHTHTHTHTLLYTRVVARHVQTEQLAQLQLTKY
jgi:hypothetical protein